MSHDNENSENKKKHLNYGHKSEAEFDAWQTRILAVPESAGKVRN